jgi:hypothetical protein
LALAAIFGSLTGALTSSVSTWISQRHEDRLDILAKRIFRRCSCIQALSAKRRHALADANGWLPLISLRLAHFIAGAAFATRTMVQSTCFPLEVLSLALVPFTTYVKSLPTTKSVTFNFVFSPVRQVYSLPDVDTNDKSYR